MMMAKSSQVRFEDKKWFSRFGNSLNHQEIKEGISGRRIAVIFTTNVFAYKIKYSTEVS